MLNSKQNSVLKPHVGLDMRDRGNLIKTLVTGDGPGVFAWKLLKSYSASELGSNAVAVRVDLAKGGFFDWDSSETLVPVWRSVGVDSADYVKATEPVDLDEGDSAVFQITEIRGAVLEFWCTDQLEATFQVKPLAQAQAMIQQVKAEKAAVIAEKEDTLLGKLGFSQGAAGGTAIAIAALAVIGLVVYGIVATPGAAANVVGAVK